MLFYIFKPATKAAKGFGEGQAGNRPKTENPGAGASSTCSGKAGAWGLAYTDQDGSPGLGKSSG